MLRLPLLKKLVASNCISYLMEGRVASKMAFMHKKKEVDEECGGEGDSLSGLHKNSSNVI